MRLSVVDGHVVLARVMLEDIETLEVIELAQEELVTADTDLSD